MLFPWAVCSFFLEKEAGQVFIQPMLALNLVSNCRLPWITYFLPVFSKCWDYRHVSPFPGGEIPQWLRPYPGWSQRHTLLIPKVTLISGSRCKVDPQVWDEPGVHIVSSRTASETLSGKKRRKQTKKNIQTRRRRRRKTDSILPQLAEEPSLVSSTYITQLSVICNSSSREILYP